MKKQLPVKRLAYFLRKFVEVSHDVQKNYQLIGRRWVAGDVVVDEKIIEELLKVGAPIEIYVSKNFEVAEVKNADRPTEGGYS
jgi:hypothetical protein